MHKFCLSSLRDLDGLLAGGPSAKALGYFQSARATLNYLPFLQTPKIGGQRVEVQQLGRFIHLYLF